MSAVDIEAHRAFLVTLGITLQEIELTIGVIRSTLRGDEVAMPNSIIPLLPAKWVRNYVEVDRRQHERRPHLWAPQDLETIRERAIFYEQAAIVMDMRSRQGDEDAASVADALRAHVDFLQTFEGTGQGHA